MSNRARIREPLTFLYGEQRAGRLLPELPAIMERFRQDAANPPQQFQLTERDAVLIVYGDQVQVAGEPPLATLADFLTAHLGDAITGVHLLPFYPYSSDDGFSVIDYRAVDPRLGDWDDIRRLSERYRLMFDAVINHISRRSEWFQAFTRGEEPYTGYFVTASPDTDLSAVVRPRALPLLTPVETRSGVQHVWTTFSDDQIDLNYANPAVLLEIIDLLLYYVHRGAQIIRLDAIAYLWKDPATPCIHLPQTHRVIKLMRAVLDEVAPEVILITETNVPHDENVSYFGEVLPGGRRTDEAQMVYNFSLAPLVLHTFATADATVLSRWAQGLTTPADETFFFNFIASHDGIGVRPVEGLLEPEEVEALIAQTLWHGGQVSYRQNPDQTRSVYELNITLYDWLNDPAGSGSAGDDLNLNVQRFLAAQVIMLSLRGVPGIYFHSLFGMQNCHACVEESGRARSINREKFTRERLEAELSNPETRASRVFRGYKHLLEVRAAHPAFHPAGRQEVLLLGQRGVFPLARYSPGGEETVICLVNVTGQAQTVHLPVGRAGVPGAVRWRDLICGREYVAEGDVLAVPMAPFGYHWLCGSEQ